MGRDVCALTYRVSFGNRDNCTILVGPVKTPMSLRSMNYKEGQMKKPTTGQNGFTLLEVMIVVVILGILAALVVPRIISRPDEARVIAAKQDIASFMQALKLYRLDNLRYPSTEQGLQALVPKSVALSLPPHWKN